MSGHNITHRKTDQPESEAWKLRAMDLSRPEKIHFILSGAQIFILLVMCLGLFAKYADERDFRKSLVTISDLEAVQDVAKSYWPQAEYIQTRRVILDRRLAIEARNK